MEVQSSFINASGKATLLYSDISPQGRFVPSEAIVSSYILNWFVTVLDVSITCGIAYVGIAVNIITIIIFYRQGYKETTNISLTAIALWDLIKCLCGAVFRFYGPAKLISPAFFTTFYSHVINFSYIATFSTYVSAVLAGYVAVERCLCVSLPFAVKILLTPKVVTSVNVLLSLVVFGSFSITFSMHEIMWVYDPLLNATVASYKYSDVYYRYPQIMAYFNAIGFIWPSLALITMCFCTVAIVFHLRKASKFRSANLGQTQGNNSKELSMRDAHVIKILLVIIIIYFVNILPRLAIALTKSLVPGFYVQQYYHNLFVACAICEFLFDFINAAINPFIYFAMSSQYRESVKELYSCKRTNKCQGCYR